MDYPLTDKRTKGTLLMLDFFNSAISISIWPYCILGLATFVEGPITLLAAGAGIALGKLLPLPAYLAIVAGNLSADLGWYSLGRFGKKEWIKRIALKLKIDPASIDQLGENVRKYAPRLLFLSKFAVGLPIPTLITVGLQRVAVRRWIALLVVGELIKSALLVTVGYLYAGGIQQTYGSVRIVLWAVTIILVITAAIYFKFHKKNAVVPSAC
jgi:membrane protein DedA with SNARE-associated domain